MKVSGYQLVKVSGNFKVYLQEGDEQKIVVEADENLVPEVKHFIVDNTLNIYTSDQVKKRITLWVTLQDVNNLNKFGRSEEHTSELQSLMRISYAVFCLKKKTKMI